MKNQKGFTLIEVMICVAIIAILGTIVFTTVLGFTSNDVSLGVNGVVETRCIEGHKYLMTSNQFGPQVTPVMTDKGLPATCTQ